MTIETKQYNKKPYPVDAVRVSEENIEEVAEWCKGEVRASGDSNSYIKVHVVRPMNERQTKAFVGDWVLHAGTGFKVYGNAAFQKSFEKAEVKHRDAGSGQYVSEEYAEKNQSTTVAES